MNLTKDIVLDDEQMKKAAKEYAALADDINKLEKQIDSMLDELAKGFNTPAGRKFIKSCRSSLLQPMKDQALVIDHVSENLKKAQSAYQSVFTEYKKLNSAIK